MQFCWFKCAYLVSNSSLIRSGARKKSKSVFYNCPQYSVNVFKLSVKKDIDIILIHTYVTIEGNFRSIQIQRDNEIIQSL
jgi:hypothetical protein